MPTLDSQSPFSQSSPETVWCQNAVDPVDACPRSSLCRQPALIPGTLVETAKVMIVDDEPSNVTLLKAHLTAAGYRHFVTGTDPRLVAPMILRELPDLLLLDDLMPEISGLEILRKVREKTNSCRISRRSC